MTHNYIYQKPHWFVFLFEVETPKVDVETDEMKKKLFSIFIMSKIVL